MIRRVISTGKTDHIYYRFTCEQCGYCSHWIEYCVVGGSSATVNNMNRITLLRDTE